MKKIVCELCEGTVFDKVDGRFVCKGCGTSYSAEEARGMMREVEGDEPVATGAPVMPQANPNQQQLDNILMLATSSYEADNEAEAEKYCNQAIVLDAMCYKAWFLKGKAIGWQSKLSNNRMEEAAHSFCKAIDFAPEDEKDDLKEQAAEELKKLGLACISLRKENFMGSPGDSELNGFENDRVVLFNALKVLLNHGNAVDIPDGFLEEVANMMNEAAVGALHWLRDIWNKADHPSDEDFSTYVDWLGNIESLIRQAIDVSDDDDEEDIIRYKNLAIVLEEPIGQHSYKQYWDSYRGEYRWTPSRSLNDTAVSFRKIEAKLAREKAALLEMRVANKKAAEARKAEEEKKARIDAYWAAHSEEKAALEAEKKELTEKSTALGKEIAEIDSQISALDPNGKVPSEEEKSKLEDEIRELSNRRAKLGLFAGKEKKQINEDIAALEGRKDALNAKIEEEKKAKKAEADQKMAPLKTKRSELSGQKETADKRIAAINKELTKDPEE